MQQLFQQRNTDVILLLLDIDNRYFVPSDGDDAEHPNVFQLPSAVVASSSNGTLRLGDVAKNFPLPGTYHFRFKKKFRDGFVWVSVCMSM
jgi:hypothetical protein